MDQITQKLPLSILNRLRLGRDVSAEVKSDDPEWKSWILISPIVRGSGSGPVTFSPDIVRFRIMHYTVIAVAIDRLWDGELLDGEARTQIVTVTNEDDISSSISQWLLKLEDLRQPSIESDLVYEKICALFRIQGPHGTPRLLWTQHLTA
jgi:hypothetical protein